VVDEEPQECQLGTDDARNASAWANVALSLFSLFSTPVVASLSDIQGRKRMVIGSILLNCLPALMLLCMMEFKNFPPMYYYAASSLYGTIDFLTIMFAALADVIPENDRAPAYGLLLASFYGGYSLAPSIPLLCTSHKQVAVLSLILLGLGLGVSIIWLPETLSPENQKQAMEEQAAAEATEKRTWVRTIMRPLLEISVLGNSLALALVAAGAFCEEMVFASDDSLVM
jgi:MFS family permease